MVEDKPRLAILTARLNQLQLKRL